MAVRRSNHYTKEADLFYIINFFALGAAAVLAGQIVAVALTGHTDVNKGNTL